MLEVIKDPALEKISFIEHGFFTRQGGVSEGAFASLNCSYSQDEPHLVRENRRRVASYFGQPYKSLVSLENVHGNQVVIVENPWQEQLAPIGDAMVTKQKNIILGADTADCACVLFADTINQVVGICHAGWRGAKQGIIAATIEKMLQLGAKTETLTGVIGPCISQNSYEVDRAFYQEFLSENAQNSLYFKPAFRGEHFLFDLRNYVKNKIIELNVVNISAIETDTYSDEKRFFSYRRTTHRKETQFGGHFACIYLT